MNAAEQIKPEDLDSLERFSIGGYAIGFACRHVKGRLLKWKLERKKSQSRRFIASILQMCQFALCCWNSRTILFCPRHCAHFCNMQSRSGREMSNNSSTNSKYILQPIRFVRSKGQFIAHNSCVERMLHTYYTLRMHLYTCYLTVSHDCARHNDFVFKRNASH